MQLKAAQLQGQAFQRDVFERVERQYLLGLRVSDPDMRHRFFELYNGNLAPTLFERLKFIICAQDWEAASGGFWLKQALVCVCETPMLNL